MEAHQNQAPFMKQSYFLLTCFLLVLFACKKTENIGKRAELATTSASHGSVPDARWHVKMMQFMGVNVTVVYMSGCYNGSYESSASGVKITVSCSPGCDICQGRITLGKVSTDANGNAAILDYGEAVTDQQFGGLIGRSLDGQNLIFGAAQNLMTETTYEKLFSGDKILLHNDFCLDQRTAEVIGLDTDHMVVPAGDYDLYREGSILWWSVPISQLKTVL